MNDDPQKHGINEGGRGRTFALSGPKSRPSSVDRGRKASLPSQSNVDINDRHRRSRSTTLFGSPRTHSRISSSTLDTSPVVTPFQATVPKIVIAAQLPFHSITNAESLPLEISTTADATHTVIQGPLQPNEIRSDDPRTAKRTAPEDDHREQPVHGSLASVNQAPSPPPQETRALKPKADRLRILKKMLAVLLRKKKAPAESAPKEPTQYQPSSPKANHHTMGEAVLVEDDQASYHSALSSIKLRSKTADDDDDDDDDNMSYFSAKSTGCDDFYDFYVSPAENTSLPSSFDKTAGVNQPFRSEAYSRLANVGTMADPAHSDAAGTSALSSIPTSVTSFQPRPDVPDGDLHGGIEVPIESGTLIEETTDDSSSSYSSSGFLLASPQSIRQLDVVKVVSSPVIREHPAITSDEDPMANPPTGGKGKIDSATSEMGNHESLLFQMEFDSSIIETNLTGQIVDESRHLVDAGLPSAEGASGVVRSRAGIMQECRFCDIQERHTSLTVDAQVVAVAHASPDVTVRPELVPLPCDEGDSGLAAALERSTRSVVQEQTVLRVEAQTVANPQAQDASGQRRIPPKVEVVSDVTASSEVRMQDTSFSAVQGKQTDRIVETRTMTQVINTASPLADAEGEQSSLSRPSDEQTSDTSTNEARVQESTQSLVQEGNQTVKTQSTELAVDVSQPRVDAGAELLQQFLQLAERLASPGTKKAAIDDGFTEGDLERLFPQAKPVNLVFNFTHNHVSNVAHGAAGDNFYGAIGQSAVGGQGGRNDIRNHQTAGLTHTTQSYESQTHLENTVSAAH